MHSESIQNPSLFFNSVMLQPDTTIVYILGFFLINLHSVPHMTKWKQNFRNVCKFIKKIFNFNCKLIFLINKTKISHLHKYSDPLRCFYTLTGVHLW